jgi:hypothetical protein
LIDLNFLDLLEENVLSMGYFCGKYLLSIFKYLSRCKYLLSTGTSMGIYASVGSHVCVSLVCVLFKSTLSPNNPTHLFSYWGALEHRGESGGVAVGLGVLLRAGGGEARLLFTFFKFDLNILFYLFFSTWQST